MESSRATGEVQGATSGHKAVEHFSVDIKAAEFFFVSLVTLGLLGFAAGRVFRWSIYVFAGKYSPAT
jgi:hypothetical protein